MAQDPTGSPRSFRLDPFRSRSWFANRRAIRRDDQDTEQVRTGTAYRDRGSVQSKLYRVERSAPETSVEVTRATDPISCHACRRAYVNHSIETRSVLDAVF